MRISASWTSARFRQIAETVETLHENEDQARDHFSNTNSSSVPQLTSKAFPPIGRERMLMAYGCRGVQNWKRTLLVMQLKLSRCEEDEECSAYAALRNRAKASHDSKREVLASIGEDMRTVSRYIELMRLR